MRQAEEIRLDTRAGRMALLHWKSAVKNAPTVLCLHGWLDNAASFIPLAQHLEGLDLYALDFPGHGHSDHRPPGVRYAFTEYMYDLDAVLDALGREQVSLLGHSLGGGVACIFAAAAPERVRSLVLLDGLGPVSANEDRTVRRLRESLEWLRRQRTPLRRFESIEQMSKAREEGFLEISPDAARMICERAARREVDDEGEHFLWRTDPALRWHSPLMLTEAQVLSCLAEVKAPMLSFHAQPWTATHFQDAMQRRQGVLQNATFADVEGNHHFHMDEAEDIAPRIQAFFEENS